MPWHAHSVASVWHARGAPLHIEKMSYESFVVMGKPLPTRLKKRGRTDDIEAMHNEMALMREQVAKQGVIMERLVSRLERP